MSDMRRKVVEAIDSSRRDIVQFAQQIVRIRSICSEDQKNVTDFIASKFRELGFETSLIEEVKTKINVAGHWKGTGTEKSIGYYSHHDTMPIDNLANWEYDPFGGEIVDGKIAGIGSADCKGGIAAAVGMAMAFRKLGLRLKGGLTLVGCMGEVTSEEVGMKSVVRAGHFNVSAAVQGDPTPSDQGVDSMTTHHYGLLVLNVIIHGVVGHALFPGYGINSIEKIPEVLDALMKAEIPHEKYKMYPHRPFIMLDRVASAGAPGHTPVRSSIIIRVHLLPYQDKEVGLKAIQATLDKLGRKDKELKVEVQELAWTKGDEVGDWKESQELYRIMQKVAVELRGKELTPVCMTAPAMAHYVIQAGIPTLVWGPGRGFTSKAHQANEFLGVEDLMEVTKAYSLIAMDYLGYET